MWIQYHISYMHKLPSAFYSGELIKTYIHVHVACLPLSAEFPEKTEKIKREIRLLFIAKKYICT